MIRARRLLSAALLAAVASSTQAAPTEVDLDTKEVKAGGTPVGDLIRIPLERVEVAENIFFQKIMAGAYHFGSQFDDQSNALPKIHYAAGRPFTVRLVLTVFL